VDGQCHAQYDNDCNEYISFSVHREGNIRESTFKRKREVFCFFFARVGFFGPQATNNLLRSFGLAIQGMTTTLQDSFLVHDLSPETSAAKTQKRIGSLDILRGVCLVQLYLIILLFCVCIFTIFS